MEPLEGSRTDDARMFESVLHKSITGVGGGSGMVAAMVLIELQKHPMPGGPVFDLDGPARLWYSGQGCDLVVTELPDVLPPARVTFADFALPLDLREDAADDLGTELPRAAGALVHRMTRDEVEGPGPLQDMFEDHEGAEQVVSADLYVQGAHDGRVRGPVLRYWVPTRQTGEPLAVESEKPLDEFDSEAEREARQMFGARFINPLMFGLALLACKNVTVTRFPPGSGNRLHYDVPFVGALRPPSDGEERYIPAEATDRPPPGRFARLPRREAPTGRRGGRGLYWVSEEGA